ncbi:MAG TPA: hypothetical protein VFS08_04325 [Gemmatimonadaceae bacterium]|nr:hypothetical protein [Gemmatimonadaceae bacterium]
MVTPSSAPSRAPALYFLGRPAGAPADAPAFAFRLPCPPAWPDRAPSAWAAERRARRAYFAALDALRTGAVDPEEEAKARRLMQDLKSPIASGAVRHFLRVFELVHRSGEPIIPTPPQPLAELTVTAPPTGDLLDAESLAARYRWAFDWLAARRYVVGKGLRVDWRMRRMTLAGLVVVPIATGTAPLAPRSAEHRVTASH